MIHTVGHNNSCKARLYQHRCNNMIHTVGHNNSCKARLYQYRCNNVIHTVGHNNSCCSVAILIVMKFMQYMDENCKVEY
jgi:hypothetical protein